MASFNYFRVLAGADKEMMHSAMLGYILRDHPKLAGRLFPDFPTPCRRVELEKPYTVEMAAVGNAGRGNKRLRIDLEVLGNDERRLLVIENKFKAFPTLRQLECYDDIYAPMIGLTKTCYLVCFAGEHVPFQNKGKIRTRTLEWSILTYRTVVEAMSVYLAEEKAGFEDSVVMFLTHYIEYLNEYYGQYDAVMSNYANAFAASADEASASVHDNRFWQRLMLSALGNNFALRRSKDRRISAPGDEVIFADGSTSAPFLLIVPEHWNKSGDESPYVLCIQMQNDKYKLYIDKIDYTAMQSKEAQNKLIDHIARLHRELEQEKGTCVPLDRVRSRLTNGNRSFTIYWEKVNAKASFDELAEQLWNFFEVVGTAIEPIPF